MQAIEQFRTRYPQGSLASELVRVEHGKYVVMASASDKGVVLATGLAAADTVEEAEDRARDRALAVLGAELRAAAVPPSTHSDREELPSRSSPLPRELVGTARAESQPIALSGGPVDFPPREEPEPVPPPTLDFEEFEPPLGEYEPLGNGSSYEEPPSETQTPLWEPDSSPFEDGELPWSSEASAASFDDVSSLPEPPAKSKSSKATKSSKSKPAAPPAQTPSESSDRSDLMEQISVEMKRLQWTKQEGVQFLIDRYGKRSRSQLTDQQLVEFCNYLKEQV